MSCVMYVCIRTYSIYASHIMRDQTEGHGTGIKSKLDPTSHDREKPEGTIVRSKKLCYVCLRIWGRPVGLVFGVV